MLLVVMPFVTSSDALVTSIFLLTVVGPRAPSSVLAPSSDALHGKTIHCHVYLRYPDTNNGNMRDFGGISRCLNKQAQGSVILDIIIYLMAKSLGLEMIMAHAVCLHTFGQLLQFGSQSIRAQDHP